MITNYTSYTLAPSGEVWIPINPPTKGLHLHIIPISIGANPAYDLVKYEITKDKNAFIAPIEGSFYLNTSGALNQASIEYQYFNACNDEQAFLHILNESVSNSSIQIQLTQTDGYIYTSVVYDDHP